MEKEKRADSICEINHNCGTSNYNCYTFVDEFYRISGKRGIESHVSLYMKR